MSDPILHQFLAAAIPGDAITDYAFLLRGWLRDMGYHSDIFATRNDPRLVQQVRPLTAYRRNGAEQHAIYHHCTGTDLVEQLADLAPELLLIYHNITPPDFFAALDPVLARQMRRGREQLAALRSHTRLALGVSAYNERELQAAGFARTAVLPLSLDTSGYDTATDDEFMARFAGPGPIILFVGRLVPNKKQEDLIKLFYYFRRLQPAAQLLLVGDKWFAAYADWLAALAADLGLEDAVHLTGHVSNQSLSTAYRLADVYVSMSEHEGVGKPLLESMHLNLPILAYAAAGVPETLGGTGIIFHEKNYPALAELLDLLVSDTRLRERICERQRVRVRDFSPAAVRAQFERYLAQLNRAPATARQPALNSPTSRQS